MKNRIQKLVSRKHDNPVANAHSAKLQSIRVPADIRVLEPLGEGRRSWVYRADFRGRNAVIKVYRPYFIEKYRKRYAVDIARFEFDRNLAFRNLHAMRQHTVQPLMVLNAEEGYTTAFVQEYIEGIPLLDMIAQLGRLPKETLRLGRLIVDTATQAGLHDLDVSAGNIKVVKRNNDWVPVIYDFNMMPQHLYAPNPFMALGFLLGIRSKSHRDYRSLREWQKSGELAARKKSHLQR